LFTAHSSVYNNFMKSFLKTFVFSLIAILVTQYLIESFSFGANHQRNLVLIVIALALLYRFIKPLFAIISLPKAGIGFLFLSFILTLIIIYVLTVFISGFKIKEAVFPELLIFGFMLPSKQLTLLQTFVYSALFVSFLYTFFDWLCER
jgi:uncharacterized membrane protein YvlD (DUF360 family)